MQVSTPTSAAVSLLTPRPVSVNTCGSGRTRQRAMSRACLGPPAGGLCCLIAAGDHEWLGSREFSAAHHVRFPYVVGEMANGIATADMVVAAARAGVLGFFGAAGLSPVRVEAAIDEIQRAVGADAVGSNLIHSPNEPDLEAAIVALYLRRGVPRVSASAYMALSPHVVHYALHGCTSTRRDTSSAARTCSRKSRAPKWRGSSWRRRRPTWSPRSSRKARSPRTRRASRRTSRWLKTSPLKLTRAATPTTVR